MTTRIKKQGNKFYMYGTNLRNTVIFYPRLSWLVYQVRDCVGGTAILVRLT